MLLYKQSGIWGTENLATGMQPVILLLIFHRAEGNSARGEGLQPSERRRAGEEEEKWGNFAALNESNGERGTASVRENRLLRTFTGSIFTIRNVPKWLFTKVAASSMKNSYVGEKKKNPRPCCFKRTPTVLCEPETCRINPTLLVLSSHSSCLINLSKQPE